MRIELKLVVFDWAGTTVDYGSFAPVAAFIAAFKSNGVILTASEARGPMGLHKKDHIRALFELPRIADQWQSHHGQPWTEDDVEHIYETVLPLQIEEAQDRTALIPGVLECVAELRSKGIRIGATTGYPRSVAAPIIRAAAEQGYVPDATVCADEVPAGRPAPWMIFRIMQELDVFPPACVAKVGDTVPDIQAGLNAGALSFGVTQSGSEVGLTQEEFEALSADERMSLSNRASERLQAAGATGVVHTLDELPAVLDLIESTV